jgi:hypothetical protein
MEVQAGPDGTVEIVEQHQQQTQQVVPIDPPQINGHVVEGQEPVIIIEQPPPPPPKPRLYDMDLERLHVELYRNKYLTPFDFLRDIRKIVHNAEVCAIDDLERLHKAQAMLTATEVSLNDFDQPFRLECERMAVRERKRRDDRKKQREKERAEKEKEKQAQESETADPNNPYAPGTRRSARNNGQEPEVAITDPLQLERRLKRGRSAEGNLTDGHQSSEEVGEGRSPKRSRVASEEEQRASQPLPVQFTRSTTPTPGILQPPENNPQLMQPSPRRMGGFDPSLLNPAPMLDGIGFHANGTPTSAQNGVTPPPPSTLSSTPTFPTQQRLESPNPFIVAAQQPQQEAPVTPAQDPTDQQQNGTESEEQQNVLHSEETSSTPLPAPEPMEVVRTPTPLPEFHLDEYGMEQLKGYLRASTAELNIEELEQLRATCLAAIWRHRTEWDRTALIGELLSIAKEFVQEVLAEDAEMSP